MWESLRQLRFPPEFRIAPPSGGDEWAGPLARLMAALSGQGEKPGEPGSGDGDLGPGPVSDEALADLATGLWRLRQKMVEPGSDRPLEDMRKAFRHLQSVWDVLAEAGVIIQDHTDKPFDPGMSLKVLAFQPVPTVHRERVMETIKPSVYVGPRRIQMGEVIVAVPQSGAEAGPRESR